MRWVIITLGIATGLACGRSLTHPADLALRDTGAVHGAPLFAGAGTSGASAPMPDALMSCFYVPAGPEQPAASLEYVVEALVEGSEVHARLTFAPWFVDNTYGAGAIGWRKHDFDALVKSDHAVLFFGDGRGELSLQVALDYISKSPGAASGFGTLGTGGDGAVLFGDAGKLNRVSTSLDRNLNERGHASYTIDSPRTDAAYTPPPDAPDWDFRVV